MAFRLSFTMLGQWLPRPGRATWLLGVLILLCLPPAVLAQSSLEQRVKAAFLFNFIKFVEWPPGSFGQTQAPVDICLFGEDRFGSDIDRIVAGKMTHGHPLNIRRIGRADQLFGCKLIYFASTRDQMASALQSLGDQSVLTVSDDPRFLQMGGMIRFLIVDNKVRFEINLSASEQAGLKISSKLLSVAQVVHQGNGG